jgi:indoleamine 2,3-dioxygenase
MLPPIPNLADYGISPDYGFLPAELPLERLPDPYYNKWEAIVANLQGLILSKRLRGVIERLPVLSTAGLEHDSEWRRAYSLLCFMAHGYIWGGDSPAEVRSYQLRSNLVLTSSTAFTGRDFSSFAPYLDLPRSASCCYLCSRLPVEF